jgi:hypothetical protein
MSKLSELLLTALMLTGMYCAISAGSRPVSQPVIQSQQKMLVADGTDPMPLCRGGAKVCR